MIERYAVNREVAMTGKVEIITTPARLVPIDSLSPHPNNPRQGDLGAIVQSIKANGFYGAIVAQAGTNVIIVGEHRWLAAKEAGMTKVPVAFADVDDATAVKIMLADNRTSDGADYDQEQLANLLVELAESSGLEGTGYDGDDLDDLLALVKGQELPPLPSTEAPEEHYGEGVTPADIKMVQLFFTVASHFEFISKCKELQRRYGKNNITDTVLEAVRHEADRAWSAIQRGGFGCTRWHVPESRARSDPSRRKRHVHARGRKAVADPSEGGHSEREVYRGC
jgi:hypothetical protein